MKGLWQLNLSEGFRSSSLHFFHCSFGDKALFLVVFHVFLATCIIVCSISFTAITYFYSMLGFLTDYSMSLLSAAKWSDHRTTKHSREGQRKVCRHERRCFHGHFYLLMNKSDILNLEDRKVKYWSCHANTKLISIEPLVSILWIFESIHPPLVSGCVTLNSSI